MVAPTKPLLARAFGNDKWAWVPAIADLNAPKLSEVTAATGFDLSCSLFGDQEDLTGSTEKVQLPRLMCETQTFESAGATSYSMADLRVSFRPQDAAGAAGKKAWEAMDDNEIGVLVRRQGVLATADLAANQFIDSVPAQLGVKVPIKTATDASGVYAFSVSVSIIGTPVFNKAIVTG